MLASTIRTAYLYFPQEYAKKSFDSCLDIRNITPGFIQDIYVSIFRLRRLIVRGKFYKQEQVENFS